MPVRFLTPNLVDDATITATDEQTGFPASNIADKRLSKRWKGLLRETFDDCETISGWAESADGTTPTLDNVTFKEGANSINMGKSGTASNNVIYVKTNASTSDGTSRLFYAWVYITDINELRVTDALRILVGSDGGNYYQISKDKADLSNGWNRIGGTLPDDWTIIGSPVITALDYHAIWFFTPLAADTITHGNLKMDYFHFATVQVDFDLGSAQAITASVIDGHDILSTDSDIKLWHSDDAVSYTEQAEFTWNANAMAEFFSSSSHRYWRISISNTSTTIDITETREIGRVFLGIYIQPTRGMQLSGRRTRTDSGQSKRAFSGTQYADIRNKWWEVDFKLKHEPDATLTTLRDALVELGITEPLFLALEPISNPNGPYTLYGRFSRPWSESEPLNNVFDVSFKFAEDL
jgi:hypothetical protein